MGPDLSHQEIVALLAELDRIIDGDRFPPSPRIQILTGIRNKLRPPPAFGAFLHLTREAGFFGAQKLS